ncbi:DUF1206 domain-containing protein [Spirosoma utsteinense]|uniref:DUF1206 domain-containing protein n=1 Tax=Spirosoma utsteinense TaxID=2585773 RepID=A0ABR6WA47_9BACT|nr:DUF1206 domain-containing protein [Spirosoma utsteinense]MBC3786988.1 hypothetical protein [Spirosoma utsteinense]MBC3793432.1 hypothetical protein [Spirosoma utsteinense]
MVVSETVKQKSLQSVEWLAKGSYIAKAIFYGTIAVFTVQFAFGAHDADPSRKEVLEQLTGNLLGKLLLALMVLALAGHTVWRLFETWNDPYKKGFGLMGWLYRLNYLLSAITYGSLGFSAAKLLAGQRTGPDNQKQIWVARLLQLDGGSWLIVLVGSLFLLWAGLQLYKGISGKVYKSLELEGVGPIAKGFLRICSFAGFLTVAGTLAGSGWYLIKGALSEDPDWVKNMDDLIKGLQQLPYGWWLQLGAGAGFMLMAVFMVAMSRYFPLKATE